MLDVPAGNRLWKLVYLKPSERTPLLANRLAELFQEAGLPDGVFNIVHGAHDVVNSMLKHKEIPAISFVGSQPVAEHVYTTASAYGKRVQALAGAKNHSIVMPDADMHLVKETFDPHSVGGRKMHGLRRRCRGWRSS